MNELTITIQDWQRFLSADGLSEKAGCPAEDFRFMLLKELVDNAADADEEASIEGLDADCVRITDHGPGIMPEDVQKVFSLKRPLQSSKHWRRAQRGALGNGLRAVMGALYVLRGKLVIHSHGVASTITVADDGETVVKTAPSSVTTGMVIDVYVEDIERHAGRAALACEEFAGPVLTGKPSPRWFGIGAVADIKRAAPDMPLSAFVGQFGTDWEPGFDATLGEVDVGAVLHSMREHATKEPTLRAIGADAIEGDYAKELVSISYGGAELPMLVEVWATARPSDALGAKPKTTNLIINRSMALAHADIEVDGKGRVTFSCGKRWGLGKDERDDYTLRRTVAFDFFISVSAPFVPIMSSGKAPDLGAVAGDIIRLAAKTGKKAQSRLSRTKLTGITVKDVVTDLLPSAYEKVSDGGRLWANCRQLMYSMRPQILALTGKDTVADSYITSRLIPDAIAAIKGADRWKVAYDARGSFTEPHTGRSIELGTIGVAEYLNDRHSRLQVKSVPTSGLIHAPAHHRAAGLIFSEKEGFSQLIEESGLLERYDLAMASTKGMSTVAMRALLDQLAEDVEGFKLYTITDFDIAGALIADTLVSDGRRYTYSSAIEHIPLAVTWNQAQRLHDEGLSEPAGRSNASQMADRLELAGLDPDAVEFLTEEDGTGLRVEVNAMTSAELLETIEEGIEANGKPEKVIPPASSLTHYYGEIALRRRLAAMEAELRRAPAPVPPDDLADQVAAILADDGELSWDEAVARIIDGGEEDQAS